MFGVWDSHPHFVTYAGILTSKRSTTPYGIASTLLRTLSYQYITIFHSFGVMFSPGTFSAHVHSTSELLRTL
jgi:hypothetical protein